jgi:DNA-binding response OmpR family regulator
MQTLSHGLNIPMNAKDIRWYEDRHVITIGRRTIKLTPTEFRLLFLLRHGSAVTYADLASHVYKCEVDSTVRVMMDKHIDHIRGKMRGTGLYLYCVLNYGYLILPETW